MSVTFELDGLEFQALNAGPVFTFTEAISFFVNADSQEEIDDLWEKLTSGGGEPGQCGWLKDKYGLSWQIVPPVLGDLLSDKDPARAGRAMQAMLGMTKLDIAALKAAADAG
jgi:predicted 3-demethylubiquinone-9 3-methyltransferase (glyoxalase superfamily)